MLTRAKRAVLCILILASAVIIIIVMTLISVPYLAVLLLVMYFCTMCSIEIAFLSVTFRPTDSSIRVASFLARSVCGFCCVYFGPVTFLLDFIYICTCFYFILSFLCFCFLPVFSLIIIIIIIIIITMMIIIIYHYPLYLLHSN